MVYYFKFYFYLFLIITLCTDCKKSQRESPSVNNTVAPLFETDNLIAWCVVPFDKNRRSPSARATMLKKLGFTKFAYDWREEHLPSFPEEAQALEANDIELAAVWWWIDGQGDHLLNNSNRQLLHYMDSLEIACDIWMSFDDRFFENLDDSLKLAKAVNSVLQLHEAAASVNAKLQLYNHGTWFGDPRNQIKIIETSGLTDVGIVYNFHHAHQQIDEFPELLSAMLPYLNTVNINGMRAEGPKILTVGLGSDEHNMLALLKASGFDGNIGIIGHLENEDVRQVLHRNLQGLQEIARNLK